MRCSSLLLALAGSTCLVAAQAQGPDPAELEKLKARAEALTKALSAVTADGKMTQSDEGLKKLEEILAELKEIRARLKRLEAGQPKPPTPAPATKKLDPIAISGFMQNQYIISNLQQGPFDAIRVRRARLNFTQTLDSKTVGRYSVEFANGTPQNQAQLRDAFISYRPEGRDAPFGTTLIAGQQNTPMGYEISWGSGNRPWPERAQYNQTLFAAERGQGLLIQRGTKEVYGYIGIWNPLTLNDPERVNTPSVGKPSLIIGGRAKTRDLEVGLSAMFGKRPQFRPNGSNVISPETERNFFYLDGQWNPGHGRVWVRAEGMIGKDRIPNATPSANAFANPVSGYHAELDYQLTKQDLLMLRQEEFDRNRGPKGDTFHMVGFGLVRDLSDYLRLTISYEWVTDATAPFGKSRYNLLTLRTQIRF
ncbi:MAG: hypothetical protein JST35_02320 [Armatimonadetes bacterium]|nr:hypothetical protein [Armatimonadota bacterium]